MTPAPKRNNKKDRVSQNRPQVWLGYCRVSSLRQRDEGTSLESQQAAIEAAAGAAGARIEWFIEAASGADPSRTQIQRLRAAIRQGRGDAVVVAKLDRFTRSQAELVTVLEEIKSAGLTFRSLDLGLDTSTPTGEFMVQVIAAVSQLDRAFILERTFDGIERRWEKGLWVRGQVPTGYRKDQSRLLEPDPRLAPVVVQIKKMFVEGKSGQRIADHLNSEGITSPKGVLWTRGVIYEILDFNYSGGAHSKRSSVRLPAITSRELERSVRRHRRQRRGHSTDRKHDGLFPARGRAFCSACGGRLYASVEGKNGAGWYWCKNRYGSYPCPTPRVRADQLHSQLSESIFTVAHDPTTYSRLITESLASIDTKIGGLESGLPDLEGELQREYMRLERLSLVFTEDAISEETYRAKVAPIRRRIAELEARQAEDVDTLAELEELKTLRAGAIRELEQTEMRADGRLPLGFSFHPDAAYDENQAALYVSEHAPLPESDDLNERLKITLDRIDARVEIDINRSVTLTAQLPVGSYKESVESSSE